MTDILASLMHKGVLSLDLVAQDGMRHPCVGYCAIVSRLRLAPGMS
jgi:hypothetical protein